MGKHSIRMQDLPSELARFADRLSDHGARAMVGAAGMSKLDVLKVTDKEGVTDRGEYKRGWTVNPLPYEEGAILYNSAPHAIFVEEDTRPHWAPYEELLDWVVRKVMDGPIRSVETLRKRAGKQKKSGEYTEAAIRAGWIYIIAAEITKAIQYSIAHKGTEGKKILSQAYPGFPDNVKKSLEKELDKV